MSKFNRISSLLFLIFIATAQSSYATSNCAELLTTRNPERGTDGTSGLIAYLSSLLEHQIIGDPELLRLLSGLEDGIFKNPIQDEQTWISSAALIHQEEIQEYFHRANIDQEVLKEWSKKSLSENERVRVKREETKIETQDTHQKAVFHPVPKGKFLMGELGNKVEVNLTHPFEMMSTDVTQKMWVEEMGENPSHFQDGEHTVTVNVNGRPVKMQPDNPVERITWWSAITYANRKSVKMGLRPAYDLSQIEWKPGTSAEAGTLEPITSIVEADKKTKIEAPNGNIYQTEGFRMPTDAEWEYVLRNLGQSNSKYPNDIDKSDLADYAWYSANSSNKTHPVGTTAKFFQINGKEYYDLLGNVSKWTHDGWTETLMGGNNPYRNNLDPNHTYRAVRGGDSRALAGLELLPRPVHRGRRDRYGRAPR